MKSPRWNAAPRVGLRASLPNFETILHWRASRWFETEGLTAEAIQHALAAQDWERAGDLIQSISTEFLKRGEVLTVIGWFRSLPEGMLLSDPKLCFGYCWPLLLTGQYDVAAPLLERTEQAGKEIPSWEKFLLLKPTLREQWATTIAWLSSPNGRWNCCRKVQFLPGASSR